MNKQDFQKNQTCILKVNIHCDGCEQKVKKLLQKIDGVYSVSADAEQGKVVVTGDVEPAKLINKLKRSGKHAEIWGGQRSMMSNQNYPINPQFQNLQLVDNGKVGKANKSHNQKGQKGGGGGGQLLAHFQNIKGPQDLKVPTKQHKSVNFNLQDEEFDEYNFDDYDEEEGHGHGHGNPMHGNMMNNMMPVMGNGNGPHGPAGMMNVPNMNNHKGYDNGGGNSYGSTKKVDVIDMPIQMKGKGGNYNEVKNGNNGVMKSNGDHVGKNKEKKKNAKSEGGLLGRFLGFGKKSSKKGRAADTNKNNNNINVKEGKKGGEKLEVNSKNNMSDEDYFDFIDFDIPSLDKNSKSGKGSSGNGNGNVGQMGPIKQKGPMGQMENVPAMNSGGESYQGMQMQMQMQPPPYNNLQQQQYMAMMMNQYQQQQQQQQANMNNMYPPAMMHGRPHPSMNYMPPPPMPSHPMADPITHVFSDENTQGYCNVM